MMKEMGRDDKRDRVGGLSKKIEGARGARAVVSRYLHTILRVVLVPRTHVRTKYLLRHNDGSPGRAAGGRSH